MALLLVSRNGDLEIGAPLGLPKPGERFLQIYHIVFLEIDAEQWVDGGGDEGEVPNQLEERKLRVTFHG